jgi:hypothetical protein
MLKNPKHEYIYGICDYSAWAEVFFVQNRIVET